MTSIKSTNNITSVPLKQDRTYIGTYDNVLQYASAVIVVNTDKDCDLTIYESVDKSTTIPTTYSINGNFPYSQIYTITTPYIYFTIKNTSGDDMTRLQFDVIYREVSVITPPVSAQAVNISDSNGQNLNSTSGALDVFLTNSLTIGGTVDVANFPATQAVSIDTRAGAQVFSGTISAGGVSTTLSLNSNNVTNISVFGNSAGTCTLAVQFSRDNTNFYTSQYSISVAADDFGFTIPCASSYVRLKRTDAGAGVVITANIEGC
jgi:hypothetical protein